MLLRNGNNIRTFQGGFPLYHIYILDDTYILLSKDFMEPLQYNIAVSSSSLFSNIFPSIAEILNLILIHWDFRLPQPIETRNIDSFKTLKISDQFYKYSFQGI